MHGSSIRRMQKFIQLYATPMAAESNEKLTVVDIGAADKAMTYKKMFDNRWQYIGVDLVPEINVDIVVRDAYDWPIRSSSIDLVISGQAFEHIEFIWRTIEEIARIMKPNALCYIAAPGNGPTHRHPVDCWRFKPDGMIALAKYAKLTPLVSESRWEKSCDRPEDLAIWGDWEDVVLIAKKEFMVYPRVGATVI